MSSYASYCHDQAAYCARRARLASSPEVVAYCRSLEFRWLELAARAILFSAAGTAGLAAIAPQRLPFGVREP